MRQRRPASLRTLIVGVFVVVSLVPAPAAAQTTEGWTVPRTPGRSTRPPRRLGQQQRNAAGTARRVRGKAALFRRGSSGLEGMRGAVGQLQ